MLTALLRYMLADVDYIPVVYGIFVDSAWYIVDSREYFVDCRWCLVDSIWYLVDSIWYLVDSIWNLIDSMVVYVCVVHDSHADSIPAECGFFTGPTPCLWCLVDRLCVRSA